jgi:hypothetical protein
MVAKPAFCSMVAGMRWSVLFLALCACAGTQTPERGEAFCESYEQNYMGACRSDCEGNKEVGDTAGIEGCKAECNEDLKADDTFNEDCADRAKKL